jgi:hypothetical protein
MGTYIRVFVIGICVGYVWHATTSARNNRTAERVKR